MRTRLPSFAGHPDRLDAHLADLISYRDAEDEAVESILNERCGLVEKAIAQGGEYNGMSVLSLIGNTCDTSTLSAGDIDEQLKQALLKIIFDPKNPELQKHVLRLGELLRQQVTLQVREAVWLDEDRVRKCYREVA